MSLATRNAPLSPISVGDSDYFRTKQGDAPYPSARGNLASPPISGGSPAAIMSMSGSGAFPDAPRGHGGGPSPPPSIGRSSIGTNAFAKRDSARSTRTADIDEGVLQEHYFALRAFLQARDPNVVRQPNKARDKLLRLSSVQFYELSTDVFDELLRRQATARTPPNSPTAPPAYLLPEKTFHPKRNQARQRLSSLGPPRFRDLAADVFHELERRFPHFMGGDLPRTGSSMSMRGPVGRNGAPPTNGPGFPPRGQSRRPSDAGSMRGPMPVSPGMPNGRPLAKQLNQNNTIVPNKSTMVEEDGADEDGDAFGLEGIAGTAQRGTSEADKKIIEDYQSQVRTLQERLDAAETAMKEKEDELTSLKSSRSSEASMEKQQWDDMRITLEERLSEAQNLNESMRKELERLRGEHREDTRALREQIDELQLNGQGSGPGAAVLERENEELRGNLKEQQQVTEQVRQDASEFLQEMRAISQESTRNFERQLELERTIERLEQDVDEWRTRYARSKARTQDVRSSLHGLPMKDDARQLLQDSTFTHDNGMIRDLNVTRFQVAIDELIQTARRDDPSRVIGSMKLVVAAVRRITKDIDQAVPQGDEQSQQAMRMKARLSSTANNLITASKNFAAGGGVSPVSIVDAAASNLCAALVELLRVVKIRVSAQEELGDDDDGSLTPVDSGSTFSFQHNISTVSRQLANGGSHHQAPQQPQQQSNNLPPPPPFQGLGGMRASADSSAYSPVSSPRESMLPHSRRITQPNGLSNEATYSAYDYGTASNGHAAHNDDTIDPSDPSYWQ